MRKYYPFICLGLIVVVIIISIIFNKSKGKDQFIYYYDSYNIVSNINEDNYLYVNIYVNNKKSYFIDKGQVSDCYIQNNEDTIDLELIKIHNTNETVNYNNTEFYNFIFTYKLKYDSSSNSTWKMKDINLYMRYNNTKEYNLKIGDLTINTLSNNDDVITISNIKPLTILINNNNYLTGLIIGLRTVDDESINIQKISILDANAAVGNNIYKLDELPESNSFDEVADFDYKSITKGNEEVNIKLYKDSVYIFIPIYYNKLIVSTKFPIEFTYYLDGIEQKYILANYTYFEPTNYIMNEQELMICEIK